ncbi:hypothetical protein LLH03_05050 [bacterium]|nr:hypothetical protein [bacterium]
MLRHLLCLAALLGLGVVVTANNTVASSPYPSRIADLESAGEVVAAYDLAREWLDVEPDAQEPFTTCGDLAIRCGDPASAAAHYDSALFYGQTAELLAKLGDAQREAGLDTLALRSYRKALHLDGGNLRGMVGTARLALEDRKELLEARMTLHAALAIDPDCVPALVALAELDLTEGLNEAAQQSLRALTQKHPEAPEPHLVLGRLLAEGGRLALAQTHWREYAALEPARQETWLLRHRMFPISTRSLPIRGTQFSFSPDGKHLAYIGAGAVANTQLPIVDSEGREEPRPVCTLEGSVQSLRWSPRGDKIALLGYVRPDSQDKTASRPQRQPYNLYTVAVTDRTQRHVCSLPYCGLMDWMPDGKALCFDGSLSGRGRGVLTVRDEPEANLTTLIYPGRGESYVGVRSSPTGADLALITYSSQRGRPYGICVAPTSNPWLTRSVYTSTDYITQLYFTPEGHSLLFLQRDPGQGYAVFAMPTDGSAKAPILVLRTAYVCPPSMTPDGRQLLSYARDGLAIVSLAGIEE